MVGYGVEGVAEGVAEGMMVGVSVPATDGGGVGKVTGAVAVGGGVGKVTGAVVGRAEARAVG